MKENYLPYDRFPDPKKYFSYYLRAILCSYSPATEMAVDDEWVGFIDRSSFMIGAVELDMLVKYTTPGELNNWLKKYHVRKLVIESGINVAQKYINLCESYMQFQNHLWKEHIHSFSLILNFVELDSHDKQSIIQKITELLDWMVKSTRRGFTELFAPLMRLVFSYKDVLDNEVCIPLLEVLLSRNVFTLMVSWMTRRKQLSCALYELRDYVTEEMINNIMPFIDNAEDDNKKYERVYTYRDILPAEFVSEFMSQRIDKCPLDELYYLVLNKYMPYSNAVLERYIQTIQNEIAEREAKPNQHSSPDWLKLSIKYCVLLNFNGFALDITQLSEYQEYSKYLQFVLNPEDFDYSKVETNEEIWQHFIASEKYRPYFVAHKSEIITPELKREFELGVETKEQHKIIYGMLGYNELWEY